MTTSILSSNAGYFCCPSSIREKLEFEIKELRNQSQILTELITSLTKLEKTTQVRERAKQLVEEHKRSWAITAGKKVLDDLKKNGDYINFLKNEQQFYDDLENYLDLIYSCLILEDTDLLDEEKERIPLDTPVYAYTQAFNIIDSMLPDEEKEAAATIKFYLNYLIRKLSS